jgi:L-rhamnose mutarotase
VTDDSGVERVAFVFRLRPGALDEYVRWHDSIWPEMSELIAESGVSDYSIWCHGDLLIGTLKASPDWVTARALMAASPVQAAWSAAMADFIEWDVDADGELPLLREVFRHD